MTTLYLPSEVAAHPYSERLLLAWRACMSAGAALLELRGQPLVARELGDQLKTSVDQAAEGWVLGLLRSSFPRDRFLAEEAHEVEGDWDGGGAPYWTIDALDGTRSFVDGYPGFCVQVAYVVDGQPSLGVVHEPVAHQTFLGIAGAGSWRVDAQGARRLRLTSGDTLPEQPRFVDSVHPAGVVGRAIASVKGRFVECGSVGLKICRVAEGHADVFAKRFRFKLWDVAPGAVILEEAGGCIGTWNSTHIEYAGKQIEHETILATPAALWESARSLLEK